MNTKRILIAAGTALALGILIGPVLIHAQDDKNNGIHDQLQIMTKILEASIGKDSIDRRLHSSVFDSRIHAEYIPSVGAIFTIPITFPLHPSQDEGGGEPEEALEDDLWEHFSNTNENASSAHAPTASSDEQSVASTLRKLSDELGDKEQRLKSIASYMGEVPLIGVAQRGVFSYSIGYSKPYDPVKLSTLTHTIIQTIAHYGHRLKSLPNSERVLVVLEAPRPRGSAVIAGASDDELRRFFFGTKPDASSEKQAPSFEKALGPGGMGGMGSKANRNITSELERQLTVRKTLLGNELLSTFWVPPVSRQSKRDHRLLAFKKSDLQQEKSYDSIKGKVETTDY